MSKIYTLTGKNLDTVARRVAESLNKCGVCIIPTDTIYGIVALETCSNAVRRIYKIKGRPPQKQFIRLISGLDRVQEYTDQTLSPALLKYWPGPLTIVLRRRGGGTIALRYPDSSFLHRLFRFIDKRSIVAPSANISGEEDILDCKELVRVFGELVDCIVCRDQAVGKNAALSSPTASTIVDITGPHVQVIRQGAVKITV